MAYEFIEVEPLTERIGAVIHGVDITKPVPPHVVKELVAAIAAHQVIFFRDQKLDHEAHKAFGRLFGGLVVHTGVLHIEGHPEIVAIHSDVDSKYIAGDNWHSDLTMNPEPPMGSILYLHTVPPVGGDTMFASMYAAYEALSPRMKTYLEGLTAVNDGEHVYRPITDDPNKRFPCSNHPVVRVHPLTGRKALYVNSSYTTRINDIPKPESDALLHFLYEHCKDPNFHVRFRWKPHSVAFWDNRCTLHLAVYDYYPQVRSGFRVTVKGEKPV